MPLIDVRCSFEKPKMVIYHRFACTPICENTRTNTHLQSYIYIEVEEQLVCVWSCTHRNWFPRCGFSRDLQRWQRWCRFFVLLLLFAHNNLFVWTYYYYTWLASAEFNQLYSTWNLMLRLSIYAIREWRLQVNGKWKSNRIRCRTEKPATSKSMTVNPCSGKHIGI